MKLFDALPLLDLYKRVQNGNKDAARALRERHAKRFPRSFFHAQGYNSINAKQDLHTMYLHLTAGGAE